MIQRLLLVCLAAVWCWPAVAAGPAPALTRTLTAVRGEPPAPDFTLRDLDGHAHRLSDYRGKVVILNFWATWCPPCRKEMPSMERAWQRIQARHEPIVVLAVDVGEDADTVFTFTADYPVTFPLLLDRSAKVVDRWQVRGLPTTFVIDPRGRVAFRAIGGRAWDDPALMGPVRALTDLRD